MAEKKITEAPGVKSVTLGDVKSVEAQTGVKSVGYSSSSGSTQQTKDIDDNVKKQDAGAKKADQDAKTESSKQTDQDWKQADKGAKKLDR